MQRPKDRIAGIWKEFLVVELTYCNLKPISCCLQDNSVVISNVFLKLLETKANYSRLSGACLAHNENYPKHAVSGPAIHIIIQVNFFRLSGLLFSEDRF